MTRIAPSEQFVASPIPDLGQGDRINLGVAAIIARRPEVAQALAAINTALRTNGTLAPRCLS